MRGFLKVVIWIVVLIGILVGVYFVLPEYPQSVVKSMIQPITDAQSQVRINQVKGLTEKGLKGTDLDDLTYQILLETQAKNPCWVYELDEATGVEKVKFIGRGYTINLKDWTDYKGVLSTSATVKFEFEITNGSSVKIYPYVDGTKMELLDGKHDKENEKIRAEILSQAYTGKGLED